MFKNAKVFSGFLAFLWSTLIIELILLELTNIAFTTLLIPIILSFIGSSTLLFLFLRTYYKSRNNVAKLRKEYLESLKPKNPLRFCSSDEELLKAYKTSASELTTEKTINQPQHAKQEPSRVNNNDDEMTM